MQTELSGATYIRIPDIERSNATEFNKTINFEPLQDGANLMRLADNPDLSVDELARTKYPERNEQLYRLFSPTSDLAREYGTAIDSHVDPQRAADVKTLVNSFSEIQHGAARGFLGSKQVRDAYERLNESKVPSAWQTEVNSGDITPKPNKKDEIQEIGLGNSLVFMFGMDEKFIQPETIDRKRITNIIPVAGQLAVNAIKGRPNLGKVFKPNKTENTKPLGIFGQDLSHDSRATLGHLVAERDVDETGIPGEVISFSEDYSKIAPPEPSKEGRRIIDNLSDAQIKNASIKEAKHSLPTRADFEYFMFVKRALQAKNEDDDRL
jgi:hypothetical protein